MQEKLWTRDFTIITLGTVISLLGNSVSGFAISLLVLDYTGSTFLYTFFLVCYFLPKVFAPMLAGPYLDRRSRKKVIYSLDFLSAGIYLLLYFVIRGGFFQYGVFLAGVLVIGAIDGVYTVAYDSFFPNLISPGNFSRGYSVSSMLYPIAACMVPVAAIVYKTMGTVAPLFLFNAVSFFLAACFERSIRYQETHMAAAPREETVSLRRFRRDFREGVAYIRGERGLLVITVYFFINMLLGQGVQVLYLPFFRNHQALYASLPVDSITLCSIMSSIDVLGRLAGGLLHYRIAYPPRKKFTIALCVYAAVSVLASVDLFFPVPLMALAFFADGLLAVTSYSIRLSTTQAYVPNAMRARFNGTFQMACNAGSILGQLLSGVLGEFLPERGIIFAMMAVNLAAVYLIVYRGRADVRKVYNREV
ncbi:MAG: MFS transporter [Oscillibacter sp.]|jgi:MFS family permease|nr:MFS transporter [Oscillibacter sp.]